MLGGIILSSCKDEFNDPNPGYQEITDSIEPGIHLLSMAADSIYYGTDTFPIHIRYTDDLMLDKIKFSLATLNVTGPAFSVEYYTEDTVFVLDTFYTVPAADTVEMAVLTTCSDYARHVALKSLNVKVIP